MDYRQNTRLEKYLYLDTIEDEVDHILPGVRAQFREADHADGRATI